MAKSFPLDQKWKNLSNRGWSLLWHFDKSLAWKCVLGFLAARLEERNGNASRSLHSADQDQPPVPQAPYIPKSGPASDQKLLAHLLAMEVGWRATEEEGGATPKSPFPGRSVWLCWTLHVVFSASLLPVATPAPSFCLPDSPTWLGFTSASWYPPTPWPRMVHTRKLSVDTAVISCYCPSPFLTSWWPWRILSVLSFFFFLNYMAPAYTDDPTSDMTKFHPIWKEMYQSLDTQSWVWKKLISLIMCGLCRFMWQASLASHHHGGHNSQSFPNCNQTYLHLRVSWTWMMAGARMSHELDSAWVGEEGETGRAEGEMQRPGGGGLGGRQLEWWKGRIVRKQNWSLGLGAGIAQRGGGEGQGLDTPSGSVGSRCRVCWSLTLRLDSAPPFLLLLTPWKLNGPPSGVHTGTFRSLFPSMEWGSTVRSWRPELCPGVPEILVVTGGRMLELGQYRRRGVICPWTSMNRAWVSNALGRNANQIQAGHPQGQRMLYCLYLSHCGLRNSWKVLLRVVA